MKKFCSCLYISLLIILSACSSRPATSATPAPTIQAMLRSAKPIKIGDFPIPSSTTQPTAPPSNGPIPPPPSPPVSPPPPPASPSICQATPHPGFSEGGSRYCLPDELLYPGVDCRCAPGQKIHKAKCQPGNPNHYVVCDKYGIQCGDLRYCHAKPIIYLYPSLPTIVTIILHVPGTIPVSEPHYPAEGWHNVLAMPDSQLLYQNSWYPYLYYESELDKVNPPQAGYVIRTADLQSTFTVVLAQLGLNQKEIHDFAEYWVPKLQAYDKPYVFFTILDPVEKNRIDHVEIMPKPQTRIEISAYFKFLNAPEKVPPLTLPTRPILRSGFTMVEWGGIIEHFK